MAAPYIDQVRFCERQIDNIPEQLSLAKIPSDPRDPTSLHVVGAAVIQAIEHPDDRVNEAGSHVCDLLAAVGILRRDPAVFHGSRPYPHIPNQHYARYICGDARRQVADQLHPDARRLQLVAHRIVLEYCRERPSQHTLALRASMQDTPGADELFATVIVDDTAGDHSITLLQGAVKHGRMIPDPRPRFNRLADWREALLTPSVPVLKS